MTNEQAKKFAECLKNNYTIDFNDMADFCDTVIEALEQETVSKEVYDNEHFARKKAEQKLYEIQQNTSDDCVSRAKVITIIQNHWWNCKDIDKLVKNLPPVTPTHGTCKDCKHRDPEDKMCDCGHTIQWQLPREDNWYCADFIKRGEGE